MKRVMFVALAVGFLFVSLPSWVAAEDGAEIFTAQKCTLCHSIKGVGNTKVNGALDAVGGKLKPEEIREAITDPAGWRTKSGATRLPAMLKKNLTKDQVDALVKYLSGLKG